MGRSTRKQLTAFVVEGSSKTVEGSGGLVNSGIRFGDEDLILEAGRRIWEMNETQGT
jgi:hypothetical protein